MRDLGPRRGRRAAVVLVCLAGLGLGACTADPAAPEIAAQAAPERAPDPGSSPLVDLRSGTTERLQAIDPGDGTVLWASGVGGVVVRSVDGGQSWRASVVPGASELQLRDVEAFGPERAFALAAGPGDRSRIFATTDGGASWVEQWRNPEEVAFYDGFDFWSPQRGIAFGDSVGGRMPLLLTADGETWTSRAVGPAAILDGESGFAANGTCVIVDAGGRVWIGTGSVGTARILRSEDWGATFEAFETPIFADAEAAGVIALALDDGGSLFAVGGDIGDSASRGGRLARSSDGGRTWAVPPAEPDLDGALYGVAVRGAGAAAELVVVGPGGAAHSPDRGVTWSTLDPRSWWGVAFSPAGPAFLVGPEGRIARWDRAGSG